jgi:hypothetical protein
MTVLRSWLGIDRHMSVGDGIFLVEPVDQFAARLMESHRHGVRCAVEQDSDVSDGQSIPAPHDHDVAVGVAERRQRCSQLVARQPRCLVVVVVVWVIVDQAELQLALTFVGAAVAGEDVSSDAEQPQAYAGAGKVVAATPGNSEHLGSDVIGVGGRGRSAASESPQVVEVSVEQATEQLVV